MVTLYFCLDDYAPVMRTWSFVPRIGDTISLAEFGGNSNQLQVYEVVCEGDEEPSASIYLHRPRTGHDSQIAAQDGAESSNGQSH